MKLDLGRLHPYLFGLLPVAIYGTLHIQLFTPGEMAGRCAAALVGIGLACGVLRLLYRDAGRTSLAGSWLALCGLGFVAVTRFFPTFSPALRSQKTAGVVVAAAFALGAVGIMKLKPLPKSWSIALTLAAALILAAPATVVATGARFFANQTPTVDETVILAGVQNLYDAAKVGEAVLRGDAQWEGRPLANARTSGVLGDGKTDDTKALQKAIDALPSGGVLYLPAGVYPVSAPVLLRSGVHLVGAGMEKSIVRRVGDRTLSGAAISNVEGAHDIGLFELTVDGNRDKRKNVKDGGVLFVGAARPIAQRIRVMNTMADGLRYHAGTTDGLIDGCVIDDCGGVYGYHGVMISSPVEPADWRSNPPITTRRHRVTNNLIRRARNTGIMLFSCADVYVADNRIEDALISRGINLGPNSNRVTIARNVVLRAHSTGIHISWGSHDVEVVNNVVRDTVADGSGRGIEGQGIKAYLAVKGLRIWGNICTNCFTDGIALEPGAGQAVIGGNVVTNNHRDGIRLWAGTAGDLPVDDVAGVEVVRNFSRFNEGDGIHIMATGAKGLVKDWVVEENECTSNLGYGINVDTSCAGGKLLNNRVKGNKKGDG